MFACAYLRGWSRKDQPPIQAVGVKHVTDGLSLYLMHIKKNRSRVKHITLQLYDEEGKEVERVRVEWPGWSDCEMHAVKLNYA